MKKYPSKSIKYGFAILLFSVFLTSCQYFPFWNDESSKNLPLEESALKNIQGIYIQSFIGDNIQEFQKRFLTSLKSIKKYSITELLPDSLNNLGVLRIRVSDYTIWENEELINPFTDLGEFDVSPDTKFVRRNALVNVHISLYEAESGKILIQKYFSQPFQQIFLGNEETQNRISKEQELIRLTELLSKKVIDALLEVTLEDQPLNLKYGIGYDLISGIVFDLGDWRIRKGIKFAEAGNFEQAAEVWKIVLFEPGKNEPEDIYFQNKAAAYYNLGIVYLRQKNWLEAAEMFSNANRINRKMEYAQAWGDSIQSWLEENKSKENSMAALEAADEKEKNIEDSYSEEQPNVDKLSIVNHEDLLLKPMKLWPLESLIKNKFDQDQIPIGNEVNQ
jgi:tetratricopeptide (TPR) repeat protein